LQRAKMSNDLYDYKNAIADSSAAIKLMPESYEAYLQKCHAENQLGQYREALTDATKALEMNRMNVSNDNVAAYYNIAFAKNRLHRFQQAIDDLDKALQLNQSNKADRKDRWRIDCASVKCDAHVGLKQYEVAEKDVDEMFDVDPKSWGAYWRRAQI